MTPEEQREFERQNPHGGTMTHHVGTIVVDIDTLPPMSEVLWDELLTVAADWDAGKSELLQVAREYRQALQDETFDRALMGIARL